ncbi:hypothetical protein B2J88_44275 [Rhodococcus sp. SRB_17]|nr:hypothetical protein [Rhodococcus sp. SRB_17]
MSTVKRCTAGLAATAVIAVSVGIAGAAPATADPISDLTSVAVETLRTLGAPLGALRAPLTGQVALPFPTVKYPQGIAVDNGDVYITDGILKNVQKLAAGQTEPITLPFNDVQDPRAIAVENGNVYVADALTSQIYKIAAGESISTTLPFTDLNSPRGVAVENGDVYVTDTFNNRVLKLAAGESTPTELPFNSPYNPSAIAVDDGNVYITDFNRRQVIELPAGASEPTVLPFSSVAVISGIAVDNGDVYVTDESNSYAGNGFGSLGSLGGTPPPGGTVRKIAAGTSAATVVPFSGFGGLKGIAVENGKVYITDHGNGRVLALPVDATAPAPGIGILSGS